MIDPRIGGLALNAFDRAVETVFNSATKAAVAAP